MPQSPSTVVTFQTRPLEVGEILGETPNRNGMIKRNVCVALPGALPSL